MRGADAVVRILADEGCRVLFGYSGGAILPVYDALFRYNEQHRCEDGSEPMPLVVPANEQGAGFMAGGYARATGEVGVALVTSGPGATNLATPVRDAMADSVPMVAICGQVVSSALGSDAFQEAAVSNIMASCAKHVLLVTDPTQLEATVRSAFEIARQGRPGPVVVDIPKDVQNADIAFDGKARLAMPGFRMRAAAAADSRPDDAACQQLFEALARAKKPLIYAGGGVIADGAAPALERFVEAFGLPVTTTLMGLGGFDSRHPLALGMLGMHGTASANYAVQDCDFLLALGARFDDRVAGQPDQFAANARFIAQVDIDPAEVGKVKQVDWHHVGRLGQSLDRLTEYGRAQGAYRQPSAWQDAVAELKTRHAMNFDRQSKRIQPQAVLEAINQHAGGRAVVATGVGQHQMFAAQYLDFCQPRQWLTSGSMGTMGFGVPTAVGAQFARSDALVIAVTGDGSIRMNQGELETMTSYQLPIKVLLLNNGGDGMVRQWQKMFYGGRMASTDKTLRRKDFVLAARADGFAWAERLQDKADLESAVTAFLAHAGPAFLEVVVDPDAGVYPMIPPGAGYADMLVGEFIAAREPASAPDAP